MAAETGKDERMKSKIPSGVCGHTEKKVHLFLCETFSFSFKQSKMLMNYR